MELTSMHVSSRILVPFHPIDPKSGKCRINGDTSESLIDIDTSEVLFNGRVIQELDIFGIAEYNQIDLSPGVTFRNSVHKACYFGSRFLARPIYGRRERSFPGWRSWDSSNSSGSGDVGLEHSLSQKVAE